MESYIVRIYRRERESTERLLGLVEVPGRKEKLAFTDYDGLWEILRSSRELRPPKRKDVGRKEEGAGEPPAPAPSAGGRSARKR